MLRDFSGSWKNACIFLLRNQKDLDGGENLSFSVTHKQGPCWIELNDKQLQHPLRRTVAIIIKLKRDILDNSASLSGVCLPFQVAAISLVDLYFDPW